MDLKLLANTIKADKCVLLLGPEIITTETGQQFNDALLTSLNVAENENIVKYYAGDDFFLFNQSDDNDGKLYVYYDILNFYQNTKTSEIILRKIAQIPINLIISLNPDKFIYEVLKKNGINAEYSYYNKNKPMPDIKVPTKTNPLVYNLLGDIEESETLVLTHQDLFDFLEGALNKSKLPDNLREIIANAHSFIFLGFKFEKWYVQLLLRLLKLPKKKFSINKQITEDAKTFYSEQFNLNFTSISYSDFIENIIAELEKNKIPLRELTEAISDDVLRIKLFIEKAKIDEAIAELKKMFPKQQDDFIMQNSIYSSINEQQKNGIIDIKDYNLALQKIKYNLIEMLNEFS